MKRMHGIIEHRLALVGAGWRWCWRKNVSCTSFANVCDTGEAGMHNELVLIYHS